MKKLLVLLLMVILTVGCSTKSSTNETSASNNISIEDAKAIALKQVAGEVVYSSEQIDDGITYYEIDIKKDNVLHEFEIDVTGKVTSHDQETNKAKNNLNDKVISVEEANTIALKRVSGGKVIRNKLDEDDGVRHYEIDISFNNKHYDVDVNATTGEILAFEQDTN